MGKRKRGQPYRDHCTSFEVSHCFPCLNTYYMRLSSKHGWCVHDWLSATITAYTLTCALTAQVFNQCTYCLLGSTPCFNIIAGYCTVHRYLGPVCLASAYLTNDPNFNHIANVTDSGFDSMNPSCKNLTESALVTFLYTPNQFFRKKNPNATVAVCEWTIWFTERVNWSLQSASRWTHLGGWRRKHMTLLDTTGQDPAQCS